MSSAAPAVTRPVLTFESEPHLYRVDGRVVPSTTQVIKAVYGDLVWPWRNEFAMERGRLVHQAAHLWVMGDLDVKRLSNYIAGYVAGAIRFLSESGFEFAQHEGQPASEVRMYSETMDCAGTPDWIGTLNRRSCVIDEKTGEPGWAAGPQLFSYSHMWQELTGEVLRDRYALQLFEDGTYKLIAYKNNREDKADFLAALRVYKRREVLGR